MHEDGEGSADAVEESVGEKIFMTLNFDECGEWGVWSVGGVGLPVTVVIVEWSSKVLCEEI